MKKTICLTLALFLLMLTSGCGEPSPASSGGAAGESAAVSAAASAAASAPDKTPSIPFSDDQLYAVAWVGYNDLTDLPFYLSTYTDRDSVPIHYFSGGDYYLILPRYADMDLKLYKNDLSTGEETSALVFEESACQPFLIQCNISDIFSDATVSFACRGETAEFSPCISLQDGSVEVGDRGLNLTR